MKQSFLYGIRLRTWLRLLRENGCDRRCAPQTAAIALFGAANSLLGLRHATVSEPQEVPKAPVFILGHWRSGTTHLQYLLSQDPQYVSPSTYDVVFPHNTSLSDGRFARFLGRFLPDKRLQDRMALSMSVPNEDEIAYAAMGLPTPYLHLAFPRREARYRRFLTFEAASAAERARFMTGVRRYLSRIGSKNPGRTLLLKSPPHTARIGLLLEMFPDARFIHIHRDPHVVFQSTRHLHRTWFEHFGPVQLPGLELCEERILSTYEEMYDAYFEQISRIPSGRFWDIRFESLERDPLGELAALYDGLSLGELPRRRLKAYVSTLRAYRKNSYGELDELTKARVARRWARSFEVWGYGGAHLAPPGALLRPCEPPRLRRGSSPSCAGGFRAGGSSPRCAGGFRAGDSSSSCAGGSKARGGGS